jgi:hypothetical protein
MADSKKKDQAGKSPVVWLTVFEAAERQGNVELSNRARRELKKAGITIQQTGRGGTR